jgi:predicted metal-dependent peptidase
MFSPEQAMSEEPLEKVRLGRTWAHWNFPYLASALHSLTLIESEKVATMGVSAKWRCYWNPAKVRSWTVKQVGSVLIHEVWHCLRDHAGRASDMGALIWLLWSIAADAEINDDMVLDALIELPGDPVLPKKLQLPDGQTAEWYYNQLMKNHPKSRTVAIYGGSCADGQPREWEEAGGDEKYGPGLSRSEVKLIAREVANQIQAKGAGSVPEGVSRWAAEVLAPPKVPWQSEIMAQARSACAHVSGCWDYTYQRPSRRQSVSGGVVYASMHRPIPEIAAVVDTSGSMSDQAIGVAVNELGGLLKQLGFPLRVLSVDAAVHHVRKAFGRIDRQLFGGGGTDMTIGIAEAMKLKPRPDLIVVLTDGITDWPDQRPSVPVLVIKIGAASDATPSWARCVCIPSVELEPEEARR